MTNESSLMQEAHMGNRMQNPRQDARSVNPIFAPIVTMLLLSSCVKVVCSLSTVFRPLSTGLPEVRP